MTEQVVRGVVSTEVSTEVDIEGRGEARPSSSEGKAIPPARFFKAFANEVVRRRVFVTPEEIVLPIVSLL